MKRVYRYTIVRFMPFVETGEFANVGILMVDVQGGAFKFRLLDRKFSRVTRFFDQMEKGTYRKVIHNLRDELGELEKATLGKSVEFVEGLFDEVTRPREHVIRFSDPRVVLGGAMDEKLQELFGCYVEHEFVNREVRERVLEKGVRKLLQNAGISHRYTERKIGDSQYEARFPFVEKEGEHSAGRVIKPLSLMLDNSTKVLEHSAHWGFRVRELTKRKVLSGDVLFTVEAADELELEASIYQEAIELLQDGNVEVVPYREQERIVQFAAV